MISKKPFLAQKRHFSYGKKVSHGAYFLLHFKMPILLTVFEANLEPLFLVKKQQQKTSFPHYKMHFLVWFSIEKSGAKSGSKTVNNVGVLESLKTYSA